MLTLPINTKNSGITSMAYPARDSRASSILMVYVVAHIGCKSAKCLEYRSPENTVPVPIGTVQNSTNGKVAEWHFAIRTLFQVPEADIMSPSPLKQYI